MTFGIAGFVACFVFALGLLSVAVLYSRIKWGWKALLTLFLVLATLGFYGAFQTFLGWPKPGVPSGTVRVVWADVRDPEPGFDGAVYLWYVTPDDKRPRAAELPYSKAMSERMAKAKKQVAGGVATYMRDATEGEGRQGGGQGRPSNGRRGSNTGDEHQSKATNAGETSIKGEGEGMMIEVPQPNNTPQKDD